MNAFNWRQIFLVFPGVPLQRMLRAAFRRPKSVLAVFALATALLLPGLGSLKILLSVVDMLDSKAPSRQANLLAKSAFPGDQELSVIFQRRDGQPLNQRQLCRIRTWTRNLDFTNQELQFINSPFHVRIGQEATRELQYPLLMPLDCDAVSGPNNTRLGLVLDSPFERIFVGTRQDTVLVDLFLRNTLGGSRYGAFDPAPVSEIQTSLASAFPQAEKIQTSISSSAAFKWYFVKSLMQDQSVNLLVLVVFCFGFRALFGSWRGAFLLAASLIMSTLILFSGMGFFGTPIDILTNSLFTIVALASAEDFLYLSQAQQSQPPGSSWREPFRKLILPSFYTSLSTVIGFASLCLSDITPIRHLGLWAAVGAGLEFFIVFLMLPAFLQIFPKMRRWTRQHPTSLTRRLSVLSHMRLPVPFFHALIVIFVVASFGFTRLEVQDSLERMWDSHHSFNLSMRQLRDSFGWNGALDLVLRDSGRSAEHRAILNKISHVPGVVKIEDPYELLDFTGKDLSTSRRELQRREFALSPAYARWFSTKDPLVRATIFTSGSDLATLRPIRERVEELCGKELCFLTGDLAAYADFSDHVITTLIGSFVLSLVLVAALIFALSRALRVRAALPLIASSMWGPFVLLGLTPLVFGGVNFVTCVFAAVLVGLAGDSGIQFLFASRHGSIEEGMRSKGVGSVQMAFLASTASLAYLKSDFAQPRILGLLFAAGFICMLVGDLWLLRGFLGLKWHRKGKYGLGFDSTSETRRI